MNEFDRDALRKVGKVFEHPGDKKKRKAGECATLRCVGKSHRTNRYCGKCMSRRERVKNPFKYFFRRLRNRAIERGHSFTLTFEEWVKFCTEHNLLERRGKTAQCLSVDRKRSSEGYYYDNLKVLTVSENSIKGAADDEPDDPGDAEFGTYNPATGQPF